MGDSTTVQSGEPDCQCALRTEPPAAGCCCSAFRGPDWNRGLRTPRVTARSSSAADPTGTADHGRTRSSRRAAGRRDRATGAPPLLTSPGSPQGHRNRRPATAVAAAVWHWGAGGSGSAVHPGGPAAEPSIGADGGPSAGRPAGAAQRQTRTEGLVRSGRLGQRASCAGTRGCRPQPIGTRLETAGGAAGAASRPLQSHPQHTASQVGHVLLSTPALLASS
jgi:hypothetical protein